MKTLIPKTPTEDDLKILREALMECAQAIRQAFQIGQETAERNREDKKDGENMGSISIPDKE